MNNDFGIIFWLHLFIILLIYISPFLLSWKIVVLLVMLFYIQLLLCGNCILTIIQFKKNTSFFYYYLSKLGFNVNKGKIDFILTYVMPLLILVVALIWQLFMKKSVIF